MHKVDVKRSIETGRLWLSFGDKLSYFFPAYGIVGISVFMPSFWLYDQIIGSSKPVAIRPGEPASYFFVLVPLFLGAAIYLFQNRALRLVAVRTGRGKAENRAFVRARAKKLGHFIVLDNKDALVGITNPPFRSGSWGERVTVLFQDGEVFVNSICDPDKPSSLVSFGRNRTNVQRIVDSIAAM